MTLRELAEALSAELAGAVGSEAVERVCGVEGAAPGAVVFVEDERRLALAEAGPALAVIAPAQARDSEKPMLRVANPRLAFAQALALLYPAPRINAGVDPTAGIGDDVVLGEDVAIGAYAVVGAGSRIGRGAQIHSLVSIGRGVTVVN